MQKESLASFIDDLREAIVSRIICLVEDWELHDLAPSYLNAIESGTLPAKVTRFPIPDGGTPKDVETFINLVTEVARSLQQGKAVLVHCRGGIGRTGIFAVAVLMALGFPLADALECAREAGPGPESEEQESFLAGLKFAEKDPHVDALLNQPFSRSRQKPAPKMEEHLPIEGNRPSKKKS